MTNLMVNYVINQGLYCLELRNEEGVCLFDFKTILMQIGSAVLI